MSGRWLILVLATVACISPMPATRAADDEAEEAILTPQELQAEGVKAFQRADALRESGDHAKALEAFDEARRFFEAAKRADLAALMVGWMGECLTTLGLHQKALEVRQEGLSRLRSIHGTSDHESVAIALGRLGDALSRIGRNEKAILRHREALAMHRRLHEGDHAAVAGSHHALARCLESMGRTGDALRHHETALAMRQRLAEGDQLLVAAGLNNVATCLESMGRAAAADALAKSEREIRRSARRTR